LIEYEKELENENLILYRKQLEDIEDELKEKANIYKIK
jgi:hypothetical protein